MFFHSSLKPSNRTQPGNGHLPSQPPLPQLSPSTTDDMNATLLKPPGARDNVLKKELFGSFKGFSLRPLPMSKPSIVGASNVAYVHPVAKKVDQTETSEQACVPIRAAPLPPGPSKAQTIQKPLTSATTDPSSAPFLQKPTLKPAPGPPSDLKMFIVKDETKERPKISSPILENSTCTVKELMSPKREANVAPSLHAIQNQQTLLMNRAQVSAVKTKPDAAKQSDSSPRKFTIDKSTLKTLEISAPIKTVNFGRSQSMRSPNSETAPPKRMALASASMRRQAGAKRPLSIVDRPKNPPPPRPPQPTSSTTQDSDRNDYDDCEMIEAEHSLDSIGNSTDNIYCDIEECKAAASQNNGLLSEIVNEIDKRNYKSIYSTSTKSKAANNADETQEIYENLAKPVPGSSSNNSYPSRAPPTPPPKNPEVVSNDNIYMNTVNRKQLRPTNGIASGSKSIAAVTASRVAPSAVAKAKPAIASKPIGSLTSSSGSLAADRKNSLLSQESSQIDLKKPLTKSKSNVVKRPPALNSTAPSSSVKSLHRKFESAAAAASAAKPKK